MLRIYRRHLKACGKRSERYRRCNCPIQVEGTLGGEFIRKSLDLTSWVAASNLLAGWNASGKIGVIRQEIPSVPKAVERFFEDAQARGLRPQTIGKLKVVLEKQLVPFCERRGLTQFRQISTDEIRRFRESWSDSPISALKKLERLRSFFRFCVDNGWIEKNQCLGIKPPKWDQRPTMPFTEDEVERILAAIEKFPTNGKHGAQNRPRLRAMVLLLRYSGLRIGDAVSLTKDRVKDGKIYLRTEKTGTFVFVPVPAVVTDALSELVCGERYFWSGNGNLKSAVGDWQRSFRRLMKLADISDGHFHRFRDTAAVGWLERGLSLEQVSVLLGHRSIKVTEKHYRPWVKSLQVSLEEAVRKSWIRVVA